LYATGAAGVGSIRRRTLTSQLPEDVLRWQRPAVLVTGMRGDLADQFVFVVGRDLMSEVATRTGIGRATLYKYFPDVQSILIAWHERAIATHLELKTALAAADGQPLQRLTAVIEAYAEIERAHRDHPLAPLLHGGGQHARGRDALVQLLGQLIAQCAADGDLRADIPSEELAGYTFGALAAAADVPAGTVVSLTLAALHP
jgi:AcrR family transcriptional regulator